MADSDWTDATEGLEPGSDLGEAQAADADATGLADLLDLSAPATAVPPRGRRRMIAAIGAAAAVAIAAVAVALAAGSPTSAAQTPARALAAASRAASKLSSLTATMTEQVGSAGTIRARIEIRRSPLFESMTMTETGGGRSVPVSVILTRSAIYFKVGGSLGLPGAEAGKWIKVPLTGLGTGSPIASLLQNATGENPMSEVQMLAAGEHLHAAGSQTIDEVPTIEYTGSFAPSAALKYLPAGSRATVGGMLKLVSGNIQFSTWIDSDHRIRKLAETETIESMIVHVTITFSGFNQPVTATVPPASQIVGPPAGVLGQGSPVS